MLIKKIKIMQYYDMFKDAEKLIKTNKNDKIDINDKGDVTKVEQSDFSPFDLRFALIGVIVFVILSMPIIDSLISLYFGGNTNTITIWMVKIVLFILIFYVIQLLII